VGVRLGASPRGSLALMKTSQALALFDGLECVTPDQVQEVAVAVLAHRLVLDPAGAVFRAEPAEHCRGDRAAGGGAGVN
jgi:MoxR-like ATPase